jgi:hypothetical protein
MINAIVKDIRSLAEKCAMSADDCCDEELSLNLQEAGLILSSLASVLAEYDQ